MVRRGQSVVRKPDFPSDSLIVTEWHPGEMAVVVRVRGAIDVDGSRTVDHHLRSRIPPEARYVVVDLGLVDPLGTPGTRMLVEHATRLARTGRSLLAVASSPHVRRALEVPQVAKALRLFESLPLALAACDGSTEPAKQPAAAASKPDELTGLREEVFGLRATLRTRTVVAKALGVIQERYHLPASEPAFDVLKDSAQRHDLRLYTLARALLSTPSPQGPTWFRGRTRRPAPSLSFTQLRHDQRRNRDAVLSSLLDAGSHYMQARAAVVLLAEEPGDVLRLELSSNMPSALTDHLADVANSAPPRVRSTRVIVADVAAEHLADSELLIDAGIRAMQSTPLRTPENAFLGVLTTYHAEPGLAPTKVQLAKLDHAATEVAYWLDWHRRTVVFDALEHLHRSAATIGK